MNHADSPHYPIWWPTAVADEAPQGVIVATVNYNTKTMIAHLLWSLYHFLGDELRGVVVVDNGSTDGSLDLLQAVAAAGVCKLVVNQQNNHHGPALTQAISHVAQSQWAQGEPRPWLWLLDSDCVIARTDAASMAIKAAVEANAALIGESYWNQWHNTERFGGYSLLLDPARIWQPAIGAIPNSGDPIGDFEQSCRAQGQVTLSFPFANDGYLIHVGRSTLATVYQRAETENPHYNWAKDHQEPHFQKVPGAQAAYMALTAAFDEEVGVLTPDALIRACQRV